MGRNLLKQEGYKSKYTVEVNNRFEVLNEQSNIGKLCYLACLM